MAIDRAQKYRAMANRGKYQRLYTHLCGIQDREWRTSFAEIELILGFNLPPSACRYRQWWENPSESNGHSHALAWVVPGWETSEVDMDAETLLFRRRRSPEGNRKLSREEVWPVHPTAVWPEGLSLSRQDIYEEGGEGFRFDPSRVEVRKMDRILVGRSFRIVGPILPVCDESGAVIKEFPQSRFHNDSDLPLNRYGDGPFCRFRVARGWRRSGIYVLIGGDDPLYIGECENLESRWGPTGYGTISPRNCYKGGQETNCRINNLIFNGAKTGTAFYLWFHPIKGDKRARLSVESELVSALHPSWNK